MIWTPEMREAAMDAANKWRGTPWANRRCELGKGVDCIHFVAVILAAAGIVPETIELPQYDSALGLCCDRNVMGEIFERCLHAEELPREERQGNRRWFNQPQFGDILVWNCGKTSNHVGIYLAGEAWHVMRRDRVGPTAWEVVEPVMQSIVRLHGIGLRALPSALPPNLLA